jgi:hypothetical protein
MIPNPGIIRPRSNAIDFREFNGGHGAYSLSKDASVNKNWCENVNAAGTLDWGNKFNLNIGTASTNGFSHRIAPGNRGRPAFQITKTTATLSTAAQILLPHRLPTGSITDGDLVARFYTPNARDALMLNVYQAWISTRWALTSGHAETTSPTFYYTGVFRNTGDASDQIVVGRLNSGVNTIVVSTNIGARLTWTKPYYLRFNLNGTALKSKVWDYDVAEPGSWDISTTNASIAGPGATAMHHTNHGSLAGADLWECDWFAWDTNPANSAPLYAGG